MTAKTKPIHEVRIRAVKAAIWENETAAGTRYSVTFGRIYKDGEKWKRTENFRPDDLPLLSKVSDLAHNWISQKAASPK